MNIDMSVPIGNLAASNPGLIPVFEELRLDYCCHGSMSLEDACRKAGLMPQAVLDKCTGDHAATTASVEQDWQSASMTELADHIETTHHAFTRDALERLAVLVPKVVNAHGDTHAELPHVAELVRVLTDDLNDHMVREERVLFPWLRRLERPTEIDTGPPWSVRRPIDCMEHDHLGVAAILTGLRADTSDYAPPADACGSYRALLDLLLRLDLDLRRHIHKENNLLFPAGVLAEHDRRR